MSTQETHEPDIPINWPHGHVAVSDEPAGADARDRLRLRDVEVTITDPDDDECMMIRLGGHQHYLHSTTTRELSDMMQTRGDRAAAVTVHGVTHTLNATAARSLAQLLQKRLSEWNARARERGFPGV